MALLICFIRVIIILLKWQKPLEIIFIVGRLPVRGYDIERGKLNVRDSLIKRIENVRRTGLADEIIIEEYQVRKLTILSNMTLMFLSLDLTGEVNLTI